MDQQHPHEYTWANALYLGLYSVFSNFYGDCEHVEQNQSALMSHNDACKRNWGYAYPSLWCSSVVGIPSSCSLVWVAFHCWVGGGWKRKSSFKKILFSCSPSLDHLEKKEEVAGAWRAGMGQNAIEVIRNTCISWEAGRKLDIGKECSVVFDLQVW